MTPFRPSVSPNAGTENISICWVQITLTHRGRGDTQSGGGEGRSEGGGGGAGRQTDRPRENGRQTKRQIYKYRYTQAEASRSRRTDKRPQVHTSAQTRILTIRYEGWDFRPSGGQPLGSSLLHLPVFLTLTCSLCFLFRISVSMLHRENRGWAHRTVSTVLDRLYPSVLTKTTLGRSTHGGLHESLTATHVESVFCQKVTRSDWAAPRTTSLILLWASTTAPITGDLIGHSSPERFQGA